MSDSSGSSSSRISQQEIPRTDLESALRIPRAIAEAFGKDPTKPVMVADAVNLTPTGGRFREITGAAIGYGLTEGGYNAKRIELTELGRKIFAPTEEGQREVALREALLSPTVIEKFLKKYEDSKLPSEDIAINVLEEEMGVPPNRAEDAYEVIIESSEFVGVLTEIKGNRYVTLDELPSHGTPSEPQEDVEVSEDQIEEIVTEEAKSKTNGGPDSQGLEEVDGDGTNRVFVTHGRDTEIVEQLKDILKFGDFEPVVSVEKETLSKPVPQKVLDDMRSCDAAIIHVGAEQELLTQDGKTQKILNPNVLIEIGASMALYEQRFILLVEEGVELPSNLQGLYEVRYDGGKLDYDATMKLLQAFNEFKE